MAVVEMEEEVEEDSAEGEVDSVEEVPVMVAEDAVVEEVVVEVAAEDVVVDAVVE